MRFLLGSANLSYSAFTTSVEAGVLGADADDLGRLNNWFNNLFLNHCEQLTPARLRRMEEGWRLAAVLRAQARLRVRRGIVLPSGAEIPIEAEDIEALEDVFATIQLPLGLLNFDYAGNTIRNIGRAREVLANWAAIRVSTAGAASKQRSELKLVGFAEGRDLTRLGRAAAAARSDEAVARLWCGWLQQTDDRELAAINDKLLVAKRVFSQFWRLQPSVSNYFLANAVKPAERRLLQTIELLCNSREVVQELSLDDIRALEPLLAQPQRLPPHIRVEIADYFENKGTRSWGLADRRIVPKAWRETSGHQR